MKKYDAIMFDLDGTLLPMDTDAFAKGYLHMLAQWMEPYGYGEKEFLGAMWSGVADVIKNDGTVLNEKRFWDKFSAILGDGILEYVDLIDSFYTKDFHKAKALTSPNPDAVEAVRLARLGADKVILATNAFFPSVAVSVRLGWVGLSPDDFDLVTVYSNSTFCKPNPAYYTEICQKIEVRPEHCLMIGNNVAEDMKPAASLGFDTFLVTDYLIDPTGEADKFTRGSFSDLIGYLKAL